MAKKVIASLKREGFGITKIIKMVRSPKTGAYVFKEKIVSAQDAKKKLQELGK